MFFDNSGNSTNLQQLCNYNAVSNSDADIIESYLQGNTVLSNKQLLSADVNGDGTVDNVDLSMLNDYIIGMMTYLPVAD